MSNRKQIMSPAEMARALDRIAYEIVERAEEFEYLENIIPVGIRTRGAFLAERLHKILEKITKRELPLGILDITLYRDDLTLRSDQPIVKGTEIDVDITGKHLVLVDDVLYTGRTVRAAMDAIMDLGRPRAIQLAVMVDRGRRELPIHADYVGRNIPTSKHEKIDVLLKESDGKERVDLVNMAKK